MQNIHKTFFADEDTDNLETSIRRSKEDYLKKVEILKGLQAIQNSQWQDGKTLPKEENWDELNSKVQDFLQQRRLSKKVNCFKQKSYFKVCIYSQDVNSKDEEGRRGQR